MNFAIQVATADDYDAVGEVMFKAVREGDSPYTTAERIAWMPRPRTGEDWRKRLSAQHVLKATSEPGELVGFMSLCDNGYVDFAYILLQARGQGLFRKMYKIIEDTAKAGRVSRLSTHASVHAQPAFSAMGFDIVQKETVMIKGETLERYEMIKAL